MNEMVFTYVVYIGLFVCGYFFSQKAEKHNSKGYLYIFAILLTGIAGFRADTVGIDTVNYIDKFETIAIGQSEYAFGLEEGFKIICAALLKLWSESTFIFIIIAGITNFLIIKRFWDYKDVASLQCMVLCYYTQFYFMTMNVMRQFCAIAILFYFSRYLAKKSYVRFGVVVLLTAFFVHRSALVGLLFLVFEVTQWKMLSKRQRHILGVGIVLSPLALAYVLMSVTKYEHYFQEVNSKLGIMIPIKLLLIFFVLLQQSGFKLRIKKRRCFQETEYKVSTSRVYYIAGLCISMLGYYFTFMDRIGWYLYLFEGVCWGTVLKSKNLKYRKVIIVFLIVFMGYSFIDSIINKSQGVVPYQFVWTIE